MKDPGIKLPRYYGTFASMSLHKEGDGRSHLVLLALSSAKTPNLFVELTPLLDWHNTLDYQISWI